MTQVHTCAVPGFDTDEGGEAGREVRAGGAVLNGLIEKMALSGGLEQSRARLVWGDGVWQHGGPVTQGLGGPADAVSSRLARPKRLEAPTLPD